MSDENKQFRAGVTFLVILIAAVSIFWLSYQDYRYWEPELPGDEIEEPLPLEATEVPETELQEQVRSLTKRVENFEAFAEEVAEVDANHREVINSLLADKEEFERQLALLEANPPCLDLGTPVSTSDAPAKVASFEDGTVFFAPSCGLDHGLVPWRDAAYEHIRRNLRFRKVPAVIAQLGDGRSCLDIRDSRSFSLGVDTGEETAGSMTSPVERVIPNAIAPYTPREDLQKAQRSH